MLKERNKVIRKLFNKKYKFKNVTKMNMKAEK